jgi:hypothetical protein
MKWTITYTTNGEIIIEEYFDIDSFANRTHIIISETNKVDSMIDNLVISSGSNQ